MGGFDRADGALLSPSATTAGAQFAEALATDDHAAMGLVILTNDEQSADLPGYANLCDVL
ncbi:hypothetical protein [Luteolibacter sp. LG18]|uniref:hypothetical protein n=1 Tax=Luteolibacter sp. LG18 TaxID=2819286 RepID=UPI002B2A17FF|nr:hypothetical protein llg_20680 [Luteolibacter sp. LG18]